MNLSIIVAVSDNGVIGCDNDLPWRLPADLRRFKRLTMGHHLVIGRRTWQSIGRPLPGRKIVVISRTAGIPQDGVAFATSLADALQVGVNDTEVFVGGGGEIYRLALPLANRMYVTHVHTEIEGDVAFPDVNWGEWLLSDEERHAADDRHSMSFTFAVYDRRGPRPNQG